MYQEISKLIMYGNMDQDCILYKFADRFYVQWKPMLQFYPKAIYLGGIY